MSKKWKIQLALLTVVVVLAVGSGMAVMASGEQTTTAAGKTPTSNPLMAKVSATLHIQEQVLVDAFKTAREQLAKEGIATWIAKAVENKTITTEEKTAIDKWLAQKPDPSNKDLMKAWLEKKPAISKQGFLRLLLQAPGRIKQFAPRIGADAVMEKVSSILKIDKQVLIDAFQKAGTELKSENFGKALEKAVTDGKITSAEANQIKSWWGQKPAALDKLAPKMGPGMFGKGGMMRFPRLTGAKTR
jgi:uncharacterized protein YehS (DUF1456 family)